MGNLVSYEGLSRQLLQYRMKHNITLQAFRSLMPVVEGMRKPTHATISNLESDLYPTINSDTVFLCKAVFRNDDPHKSLGKTRRVAVKPKKDMAPKHVESPIPAIKLHYRNIDDLLDIIGELGAKKVDALREFAIFLQERV
jgi:hypothetical protein